MDKITEGDTDLDCIVFAVAFNRRNIHGKPVKAREVVHNIWLWVLY